MNDKDEEFLIEEYKQLWHLVEFYDSLEVNFVKYYFLVIAGCASITGFLWTYNITAALVILTGGVSLIFLLGVLAFSAVVSRRLNAIIYLRAINSIRNYFSTINNNRMIDVLIMPKRTDIPSNSYGRFARWLIQLLNSIFGACSFILAFSIFKHSIFTVDVLLQTIRSYLALSGTIVLLLLSLHSLAFYVLSRRIRRHD